MIVLTWLCVVVFENAFVYHRKDDKKKIITYVSNSCYLYKLHVINHLQFAEKTSE